MIERLPVCADDSDDTITMGQFIDKINEVIEAVNTRPVIADCGCWTQGNSWHRCSQHVEFIADAVPYMSQRSPEDYQPLSRSSGFRPLHIEDGQVKEESAFSVIQGEVVPPKGGYNTSRCEHSYVTINNGAHLWERCNNCGQCINKRRPSCTCSHLYGGISYNASCPLHSRTASVPEAKPQEQETIAAPFSPLEQALDEFEALAQSEEAQMRTRRGWDKFEPLVKARERVLAAAHREYAQPEKKGCDHVRVRFGCVADGHTQPPHWQYVECVDCEARMPLPVAQPGKGV